MLVPKRARLEMGILLQTRHVIWELNSQNPMYKMFQYSFIASYTDMIHVYAAFEESLIKTIRDGNFLEISKKITPKAFTKCEKNALLISMLVSPSYSINSLKVQNWKPAYDFTEIKISFELLLHDFLRTRCKLPVVYSTATQTLSCDSLKWITLTTQEKASRQT